MPESGIKYVPKQELLSFEELLRIAGLFVDLGVNKIRITGGEPLVRRGLIDFLKELSDIRGLEKINLTTNGTITTTYLPKLWEYGIRTINLSLDSLDKERFNKITRRDQFDNVMHCFYTMLEMGFKVKINCVVMEKENIHDIIPFIKLTEELPVSVRFIEEMPFNGHGKDSNILDWNYIKILEHIRTHFPDIEKIADEKNSTSVNYKVNDFKGDFGVIPAFSRTFCGTCNRIRLTPKGIIKTCLYDKGIFDLKALLREGATNDQLKTAIQEAVSGKAKNGFEAEKNRGAFLPVSESMSTIGG